MYEGSSFEPSYFFLRKTKYGYKKIDAKDLVFYFFLYICFFVETRGLKRNYCISIIKNEYARYKKRIRT